MFKIVKRYFIRSPLYFGFKDENNFLFLYGNDLGDNY